ncbi:MAG: CheR family methyltransferase [Bacteroidales bacterium]|nr:CheR family methyltransferase [Bacteroidales bacterium]
MDIKEFLNEFNKRCGYDFSDYSANSISRRLTKICEEMGLSFEQIINMVVADKKLVQTIVEDITVNTTELFRDPAVWVAYAKVLPRQIPKQTMSTIWHIGCSKGLEVYSDLVLINELGLKDRCRVIGTDINPTVLDNAAKGVYPYRFNQCYVENFNTVMKSLDLNVPFDKYFAIDEAADTITVLPHLREQARFLRQDLVKDRAPFAYRVDIVFLRNVMIYFNEQLQLRVLSNVLEKMHDGALFIMGKQEDIPQPMKAILLRQGLFYKKIKSSWP